MPRAAATCFAVGMFANLVLGQTSCLCPPCADAAAATAAAAAEPDEAEAPAPAPAGSRLLIWDGDGGGIEGGKSWADCDKKPECQALVEALPGVGKGGSTGLRFHAQGPAWNGFGWNWFGWYPETAGTDIRSYENLTFWIRVEAASPEQAPALDGVNVLLGCSKGQKNSADGQVSKYVPDLLDGKWHRVVIPLADLQQGKAGEEFDGRTAWEFRLVTWNPSPRDFNIYVDDVAFEKP